MKDFIYEALYGRVVFGDHAARDHLVDEVDRLNARRVLLLAAEAEKDLALELSAVLGGRIVGAFHDIRPHVPVSIAGRARQEAVDKRVDLLLSVGGGSTTGTAKAVALETGHPILAIPTTYAGSEMTPVWGMTDQRRKRTGRDLDVLPRAVIYDPELTLSLPPDVSVASAMNGLAHCLGAFYAPAANPITNIMAVEAAGALATGIVGVVDAPRELGSRSTTLYGACLAGAAFAVAGGGLHHKICHVLGGAYDLPHAQLHAVILPHAIALTGDPRGLVAQALGVSDPVQAGPTVFDLAARIGAPTTLSEIGMREDALDEAESLIIEQLRSTSTHRVDEAGVRRLLQDSFDGRRPSTSVDQLREERTAR